MARPYYYKMKGAKKMMQKKSKYFCTKNTNQHKKYLGFQWVKIKYIRIKPHRQSLNENKRGIIQPQ